VPALWNFKKGRVLKSTIHQQMYTMVLHTVYLLKFQRFSAPSAVLEEFNALHFSDWCICVCTYLYLRLSENGPVVPKYVGGIQNWCAVCDPTVWICWWMWLILGTMHGINNIENALKGNLEESAQERCNFGSFLYCCTAHFEDSLRFTPQWMHKLYIIY
jgi:hypothetical protein